VNREGALTQAIKKTAALSFCATLVWSAASGAAPAAVLETAGAREAAPAPAAAAALELEALAGGRASLQDLRGQIVVLNLWATWCIPCRAEMPLLAEVRERYRDRGVEVVGASADAPGRRREVEHFVRRQRLDFPIWIGATTADMERLGLGEALPATAILDRDGDIVFTILGPIAPGDLDERLDWLLGDRAAAPPAARLDRFADAAAGRGEAGGPHAHEGHGHESHAHEHDEKENHAHGGVGIEGASLVPS
jgi:thiol-disulfide isomerase/thioredoxin